MEQQDQLSEIQKLEAELAETNKRLAEAQKMKLLKEEQIKKAHMLAQVRGELVETERALNDVTGQAFKPDAKQYDVSQLKFDSRFELEKTIRKHALAQLEGTELNGYKKIALDNYVRHIAAHIDAVKTDPINRVGKQYPFTDEYEAQGYAEVVLGIKPFVKVRAQGG